jgi:hypothetical protein
MKRFAFVLALLTMLLPGVCLASGPFGFDYGMTKEQVIALVGKDAVLKDQEYMLRVSNAPRPDPSFETYLLIISPEKGLLKIMADGLTIPSSAYGTELKVGFMTVRDTVARQYGAPTHNYDFIEQGSTLNQPSDWMAGLLKKERKLGCDWDLAAAGQKSGKGKDEHISGILLETRGLKKDSGWVILSYEFEGFDAFFDSIGPKK